MEPHKDIVTSGVKNGDHAETYYKQKMILSLLDARKTSIFILGCKRTKVSLPL